MIESVLWATTAIISILTCLKLAWGLIQPAVRGVMVWLHSVAATAKRLKTLMDTVDTISKHIGPNGGSSLMDKVNLMVTGLEKLGGDFNNLEKNLTQSIEDLHVRTRMRMDLSKEMWWEADTSGAIIWISKSYLDMVQGQRSEMLGNGWVSSIHEDDRSVAFTEWRKCVNDSRDFRSRFRVVAADGSVVETRTSAAPIRSSSGEITGWMGATEIIDHDKVMS